MPVLNVNMQHGIHVQFSMIKPITCNNNNYNNKKSYGDSYVKARNYILMWSMQ